MLALPLLLLVGCGTLGLSFLTGGKDEDTGPEVVDTGPEQLPPVDADVSGRTWTADLMDAVITEPEGLGAFLALMDSTTVLFHVEAEYDDKLDLIFALTDASGQQDVCQPVLDFSGADFGGNPWVFVDRTDVDLRINGVDVTLHDAQLELRVQTYGQGFEQGWMVSEVDGRELDAALGDRIDSTVCELLDALGTDCHACGDGTESCFYVRIEELEGADYGGSFDPDADPSLCD
jgi:hypothetical protein